MSSSPYACCLKQLKLAFLYSFCWRVSLIGQQPLSSCSLHLLRLLGIHIKRAASGPCTHPPGLGLAFQCHKQEVQHHLHAFAICPPKHVTAEINCIIFFCHLCSIQAQQLKADPHDCTLGRKVMRLMLSAAIHAFAQWIESHFARKQAEPRDTSWELNVLKRLWMYHVA